MVFNVKTSTIVYISAKSVLNSRCFVEKSQYIQVYVQMKAITHSLGTPDVNVIYQ